MTARSTSTTSSRVQGEAYHELNTIATPRRGPSSREQLLAAGRRATGVIDRQLTVVIAGS